MWTRENRGHYERKGVRYSRDLRDAEQRFAPEVESLSEMLGRDLTHRLRVDE